MEVEGWDIFFVFIHIINQKSCSIYLNPNMGWVVGSILDTGIGSSKEIFIRVTEVMVQNIVECQGNRFVSHLLLYPSI